jgi:hypothetical protein
MLLTSTEPAFARPYRVNARIAASAIVLTAISFFVRAADQQSESFYNQSKPNFASRVGPIGLSEKTRRGNRNGLILKTIIALPAIRMGNRNPAFLALFIKPIIKFIRTITGSITRPITSVAMHEVLHILFVQRFFLAV